MPRRTVSVLAILILLSPAVFVPAQAHAPVRPRPAARTIRGLPSLVWGCPMCETVRQPFPGRCPKCGMALVPIGAGTGRPGGGERRLALMPGVPDWLFFTGALGTLVVSFAVVDRAGRRRRGRGRPRLDLLRWAPLRHAIRSRILQRALQSSVLVLFLLVLAAGFAGNQRPERNIAPVLTWTIWWTWLAFVILFLGKIWCTACPFVTIADGIAALGRLRRSGRPFGLGLRWPRRLRNIWPATALFVGLTWLELGYGVTTKPWLTAVLGVAMVAMATASVLIFERRAFCRYACLVGRVSGLYALCASSELRARDRNVCRECATRDCYHGAPGAAPCPTHQYLGAMEVNTYCTLCFECVRSCPHDNVAWNARLPGADLVESRRYRADEAYLAVIMLSMSAFHGLTMTPSWDRLVEAISTRTGLSELGAFTVGMAGMLALPIAVFFGLCLLMKAVTGDREHPVRQLFIRFAYSLLPIALCYHLAHNLQHVFFEGMKLVRIASDPFGWGWDLFGTARMPIDAVLPVQVGWAIQVLLVLGGHIFGIVVAHRAAASLYPEPGRALRSQLPMLAGMLAFSFQSLWLLAQPMMMRTAM
ncbi:MAG: 4Fe-4S binding protein [Acidobacteria bacterium]|nr:MAG: 4Fe-4S binding protein [Acidobacteriota bacterium]